MRRKLEGLEIDTVDLAKFAASLGGTEETVDLSGFEPVCVTAAAPVFTADWSGARDYWQEMFDDLGMTGQDR